MAEERQTGIDQSATPQIAQHSDVTDTAQHSDSNTPLDDIAQFVATAPNPLQAQTSVEALLLRRANIGHCIALMLTITFLSLSLIVLLGFVDLSHSTTSALAGSIIGFAVGKLDPILTSYFSGFLVTPRGKQ